MKKLVLLFVFICSMVATAFAQNIQLHYDFGSAMYNELDERPKFTTTVEMFKPDKWGSTYFFVDMDYADKGVASAYWEISRELRFWKAPISAHVEYNGGLNYINNAYLAGATYSWNSADFNRVFTFSALYKYIEKNEKPNNFQLTATWTVNFWKQRLTFSGFADFWREKHTDVEGNNHDFIFITEPQLWLNLNKFPKVDNDFNLSVGTEWEISTNFATRDGFYFIPTLAMKWSF
ncbi:DUF5020 family protein [uncultured Bacteroides sp.]|uniref:nucleoside-specific channel-forming Tsx family protein n=1 Tax=uncultured Bacteroides sp. TaxID=162156 RepID=UPI00260C24DC|nr:DUF5020 family protein [uncultured Bacteroides sp.]